MKNVLLSLLFIALTVALIFGIPAVLRSTLGVDQPMMTVISGSMWPDLSRGDIVIVEKTTAAEIKVGTVIVFKHQKGLAVHRVVATDGWMITTRGDANPQADTPIFYSDVVGRVPTIGSRLVKIPWVGHFTLLANPDAGVTDPGQAANTSFGEQLKLTVLNPVSLVIIIGFPLILIFQNRIMDGINTIWPVSRRKRRLQQRARRLRSRWGEERTKRALRL